MLVVDDEENLRHLLELILGRAGYAVTTARNGREALARLEQADIVLCDIRMPDMTASSSSARGRRAPRRW